MIAILKRELRSYFLTPAGYIYMGFFLLIAGIYFVFINLIRMSSDFSNFLGSILLIYLFTIPMLTMRLFSEERRQKTDQLLLTAPVTVAEIVMGKFLAAFILFLLTLGATALYALVIAVFGELALAATVGGYLGFIFLGASYISIGMFISAATENQITAGAVSFFSLLMIWLIDSVSQIFPTGITSGLIAALFLGGIVCAFLYFNTRNLYIVLAGAIVWGAVIAGLYGFNRTVFNGFIRKVFSWFSLNKRYQDFTLGIVKGEALFYYASFCGLFLFLTAQLIEKRRWN
ncbi:MAG: ABC transporter permease [Spirochaetaceae bacterium]|jgi:ABC-2 type transport system permease protein|nr:ABC transporter permease [Spirochaetaceae bacterium]